MPKRNLYLLVSDDALELPCIVTDTIQDMAGKTGHTPAGLRSCIYKKCRVIWRGIPYRIRSVPWGKEEEDAPSVHRH